MPKVPTVLDGPRSPNLNLLQPDPMLVGNKPAQPYGAPVGIVDDIEKTQRALEDRKKFRVRSPNANRVVLLYAEPDTILPGGKIARGKIYQAKFKEGYWETKDNWYTSDRQLITHEQQLAWLKQSQDWSETPGFGGMWDADQEEHTAALALYNGFVQTIQRDPKLMDMLRKDLKASDFDMISALAEAKKKQTPDAGTLEEIDPNVQE